MCCGAQKVAAAGYLGAKMKLNVIIVNRTTIAFAFQKHPNRRRRPQVGIGIDICNLAGNYTVCN